MTKQARIIEIIRQYEDGMRSYESMRLALDSMKVRGGHSFNAGYIGYDYEDQAWVQIKPQPGLTR